QANLERERRRPWLIMTNAAAEQTTMQINPHHGVSRYLAGTFLELLVIKVKRVLLPTIGSTIRTAQNRIKIGTETMRSEGSDRQFHAPKLQNSRKWYVLSLGIHRASHQV